MAGDAKLDETSPAVHAHLSIMQAVIARMAESSRANKTWCVIVVAAMLVLGAGVMDFDYQWIAFAPIALFLGLDTYYLALERCFIASYDTFLRKLRNGEAGVADLFEVAPQGSGLAAWFAALRSVSILPFYLAQAAVVALIWWLTSV